jgi:hypothetical protein
MFLQRNLDVALFVDCFSVFRCLRSHKFYRFFADWADRKMLTEGHVYISVLNWQWVNRKSKKIRLSVR